MAPKLSYVTKFKNLKDRYKLFCIDFHGPKNNLFCVICNDILIEPRQSECGYRFCNPCFNTNVNNSKRFCPGCKETSKLIDCVVNEDKAAEKEIFALEMICINKGCKVRIQLRDLPAHLEQCEYREGKCDACDESYPFKEADEHLRKHCKMIITTCKDCGAEMTKKDFDEKHKNITEDTDLLCDDWMDICPMKCSKEIQVNIKVHLNNCPRMLIECVMRHIGCTKMIARVDMDEHIRNDTCYHTNLMIEELNKLKTENEDLKYKYSKYHSRFNMEIDQLKQTIVASSSSINSLKQKVIDCDKNCSDVDNEAKILKKSLKSDALSKSLFENLQSKSMNGVFTWMVEHIYDKINIAKSGIDTQILSEPFYSHYRGYKMCLKMYPNGDGKGLRNYLSLYFVIMKGEYDDDLSWPFDRKISLSLISNKFGSCNNTITMKPDDNPDCYGKPTMKYNLAAGQPQFISHEELIKMRKFLDNCIIGICVRII